MTFYLLLAALVSVTAFLIADAVGTLLAGGLS